MVTGRANYRVVAWQALWTLDAPEKAIHARRSELELWGIAGVSDEFSPQGPTLWERQPGREMNICKSIFIKWMGRREGQ